MVSVTFGRRGNHHIRIAASGTFQHLGYSAGTGRSDRRVTHSAQQKADAIPNSTAISIANHYGRRKPNTNVVAIYGGYGINDQSRRLGQMVLRGISPFRYGTGLLLVVSIVILAILLDRITQVLGVNAGNTNYAGITWGQFPLC